MYKSFPRNYPVGLRRHYRVLFIIAVVALAVIYREEAVKIARIVLSSPPWLFFLSLLLVVVEFTLQAARMKLVFGKSWREILETYAIGLMVALSFPSRTLGEGARIAAMARELGVRTSEMAAYVSVERMVDVIVIVLVASLILLEVQPVLLILVVLGVGAFIGVLESDRAYGLVRSLSIPEVLRRYLENSRKIIKNRALFTVMFLITVVLWAVDYLRMWIIVRTMGGEIDYTAVASLVSLAYILAAASFLPGGLGAYEGGLAGGLVIKGIPYDVAIAATLYERLFSYWLWIAVGAAVGALRRDTGASS
ncbi:TPA: flippase-like domain-containing protein, partial [Candidatus Micrarchaeota archaeon]|nr:flippase-like domain-containing protein [Candidatus Micrarchaeota archaeon]